jgi:plastocyanin
MYQAFQALEPCTAPGNYQTGSVIHVHDGSFKFYPRCLRIRPGATVQFLMDADVGFTVHPLAPSTRGNAADNPIQRQTTGTQASFVFPKAGFYPFFAESYGRDDGGGMSGVVWVTDPTPSDAGVNPGELRIVPDFHDFGRVPTSQLSPPQTFVVQNVGDEPVTSLSLEVSQGGNNDFILDGNGTCATAGLAPGATCSFDIRFRSFSISIEVATITVTGASSQGKTQAIAGLQGKQLPPDAGP